MPVPIELEIFMKDLTGQGLRGVKSGVAGAETQARQLTLALQEALKAQRELLRRHESQGLSTDKDVRAIETLKTQIASLKAGLEELDEAKRTSAATPVADTEAAMRATSNLRTSFQQVARELPSLAMGPQMFILAISNNLPILADAIRNVRTENEALTASGGKAQPVWKQLAGALVSWQTALTVGVTLLVMYGDKIAEWIASMFKGTQASKEAAEAAKAHNEAMREASKAYTQTLSQNAAQNIAAYKRMRAEYLALGDDMAARKKYVTENQQAFHQLGLAVNGVSDAERLFRGNSGKVIQAFILRARAAAAAAQVVSLYQKAFGLQQQMKTTKVATYLRASDYAKLYGKDALGRTGGRTFVLPGQSWRSGLAVRLNKQEIHDQFARANKPLQDAMDQLNKQAEESISSQVKDLSKADSLLKDMKLRKYTGGVTSSSGKTGHSASSGGIGDNAAREIERRGKEALEADKKVADLLKEQREKAYEEVSDSAVETMKEGADKEIARIKLDGERKLKEINDDASKTAEALAQAAYKEYLAQSPKNNWKGWKQTSLGKLTADDWRKAVTDPNADLTAFKQQSKLFEQLSQARETYGMRARQSEQDTQLEVQRAQEQVLKDMLAKYEDFEAQRQRVARESEKAIAELEKARTAGNSGQIDRAIAVAKEKTQKAIQEINDSEAAETAKDSPFLKSLFGDLSKMSFDQLEKLVEQAKALRDYLSGTGSRDGAIKIIPADELERIEKSPAELDKLRKALDRVLKSQGEDKWTRRLEDFGKAFEELGKAKSPKAVAKSVGDIGSLAADAAKDVSAMFEAMGNTSAADALGTLGDVMGAVSSIGQGFAKGGIVGGIGAALGAVTSLFGKAAQANARHKAALKEIMNERIAQQREYNKLLLEQNLLYKEGTTIFGTDSYRKAMNSVKVMREAQEDLKDAMLGTRAQQEKWANAPSGDKHYAPLAEMLIAQNLGGYYSELKDMYSGLADVQVKTGHKKTGLFGLGKGRDIYSSVLDVYPDLIDKEGKLNVKRAEAILQTQTMTEESKEALQNMVDLANEAQEAYDQLNDYFTDIFGELGSTITDALADAFANGTDAAQKFTDSVEDMLETLAEQMVYSIALQPLFKKAQDQMMAISQDTGLSDTDRFSQYATVIGSLTTQLKNAVPQANSLMSLFKSEAKKNGLDIFQSDEEKSGSSQSGQEAAYTTMTQDQGRKLEGLFTSVQDHVSAIDKATLSLQNSQKESVRHLAQIAENTYGCKYIQPLYELAQKWDRQGIKVQ